MFFLWFGSSFFGDSSSLFAALYRCCSSLGRQSSLRGSSSSVSRAPTTTTTASQTPLRKDTSSPTTNTTTATQTPPIKTTTVSFTTATTVNGSSSYNESNNWWIILLVAIPSPILLFLSAYGMRKCYLNRKIKRREQVKKAGNIAIDDVVEYTVEGPHKNHSVMPYTNEGLHSNSPLQQDNDKAMIRKVEEDIDENKLWNKKVHLINAVYCTEDGTVKTQHEGEANQNVTRGDADCTGNIDIGDDKFELGDALYKRCVDCGKQDFGKIYGADGLFYCNQCWLCYGDTHGSNQ
eukprot:796616_1